MSSIRSQSTGHSPAPTQRNAALPIDWRPQAWEFLRSHGNTVPATLACPISYGLMRDPVSVANGQTYDRASITAWFHSVNSMTENGRFVDPRTRDVLDTFTLYPNLTVAAQVAAFKEAVLALDTSAARYFEVHPDDTLAIAPRRPRRYMAQSWEERHAPAAPSLPLRFARGGSPENTSEDVAHNAARAVAQANAFARRHAQPGVNPDLLRAYLDDLATLPTESEEENDAQAEAEADAEFRARVLASYAPREVAFEMPAGYADEDTIMQDANWSDEDAEVEEAMQAYWQTQSPPQS